MKIKKIIISAVLVVGVVLSIAGLRSYFDLKAYKKKVAEINVSDVNLSKIGDGTYTGTYDVDWVAARVSVSVKNHKIEDIKLLSHKNGRGSSAEIIPGKVVEAQSLEVDIVAGATSSSKVILKAIEDALKKSKNSTVNN